MDVVGLWIQTVQIRSIIKQPFFLSSEELEPKMCATGINVKSGLCSILANEQTWPSVLEVIERNALEVVASRIPRNYEFVKRRLSHDIWTRGRQSPVVHVPT